MRGHGKFQPTLMYKVKLKSKETIDNLFYLNKVFRTYNFAQFTSKFKAIKLFRFTENEILSYQLSKIQFKTLNKK